MGYIPKTTKQPVKLFFGLSAVRVAVGLIVMFTAFAIAKAVMTSVLAQLASVAVIIVIYLILSGRSPSNPSKNFFLGLLDYFLYAISPKIMYGTNTEEYKEYSTKEEELNARKRKKKREKSRVL